jgi:hypothetical protein
MDSRTILLITGALIAFAGFVYAAYNIRSDCRRKRFGIMAGNARFGIRAIAFGGLLCIAGLILGG